MAWRFSFSLVGCFGGEPVTAANKVMDQPAKKRNRDQAARLGMEGKS
jgi:hypothetical protein